MVCGDGGGGGRGGGGPPPPLPPLYPGFELPGFPGCAASAASTEFIVPVAVMLPTTRTVVLLLQSPPLFTVIQIVLLNFSLVILFLFPVCYGRYDYNHIEFDRKSVLIYTRTEIKCLLSPPAGDHNIGVATAGTETSKHWFRHRKHYYVTGSVNNPGGGVMVIFWFKGLHSKAPFLTVDTRHYHHHDGGAAIPGSGSQPLVPATIVGRHGGATAAAGNGTTMLRAAANGVSESFIQRISHRMDRTAARLIIDKVMPEDEGIFRCRVDFRRWRTTNAFIQLELIVPPTKVFIRSGDSNSPVIADRGLAGPYREGDHLELICDTKPAKPLPHVLWYRGRVLVDDTYHLMITATADDNNPNITTIATGHHSPSSDYQIRKPLVRARNHFRSVQSLTRADLFQPYRCVAGNTERVPAVESTIRIDMILPPVSIQIVWDETEPFHSGRDSRILCQSYGSRPVAQLHWYRRNGHHHHYQRILSNVEDYYDVDNHTSKSVLRFVPSPGDDGAELRCEAVNIRLTSGDIDVRKPPLRDSIRIIVHYLPIVQVVPDGGNETGNEPMFVENATVRLWCRVQARPAVIEPIQWFFNDTAIGADAEFRIHSDQLLIERLDPDRHHGRYRCLAANAEGRSASDDFFLPVAFAPRCRSSESTTTYPLQLNQTGPVVCQVTARPPIVYFHWYFNETPVPPEMKYTTRGSHSTLWYRIRSFNDYGQLICHGRNAVGRMTKPCRYSIVPFDDQPETRCPAFSNGDDFDQSICGEQPANGTTTEKPYQTPTEVATTVTTTTITGNDANTSKQPYFDLRKAEIILARVTENGNWIFLLVFLVFAILLAVLARTISHIQEVRTTVPTTLVSYPATTTTSATENENEVHFQRWIKLPIISKNETKTTTTPPPPGQYFTAMVDNRQRQSATAI